VEFDAEGRASQAQRLSAENLLELSHPDDESGARRAWLVRGSNVDGRDLVPEWLAGGWVSLAASQLPAVDPGIGESRLREIVADAYRHKNYSVREKLTDEFDAFLRQIRDDDYVLTMHRGDVYLGLVIGPPTFHESADRRSNLRRPVRWLNAGRSLDLTELPAPLPTLVQSQDDVIDLTAGLDALERLYAPYLIDQPTKPPLPEARLADVTDELADELLIADRGWLDELVGLLAERRQIIMYGPPGTGKTYLARKLALHLAEPHSVQLVQFHPSYPYEDFFENGDLLRDAADVRDTVEQARQLGVRVRTRRRTTPCRHSRVGSRPRPAGPRPVPGRRPPERQAAASTRLAGCTPFGVAGNFLSALLTRLHC
jgi:5-methylcytosine-specific restriction protein B